MPITPALNSVLEVTLHMRMAGQRLMNVGHYKDTSGTIGNFVDGYAVMDDFIALFDDPVNGITNKLSVFTTTALTIDTIRAQWIYPVRYAYKDYGVSVGVGTQPGDPAPQNVCVCATFQSDGVGRHSHGNIFIPGILNSKVETGFVDGGLQVDVQQYADLWMGPYTTLVEPAEFRRIIFTRALPAINEFVTHTVARDTTRVMRRRTVGHGK